MSKYIGDFAANATIRFMWNTFAVAGESITRATDGIIRIYKNSSATQRSSSAGITDTEDFDSLPGLHHIAIDTSDNTDAGFYAAGNDYMVVLDGAVIDGKTINAVLAEFSIENRRVVSGFATAANLTALQGNVNTLLTGQGTLLSDIAAIDALVAAIKAVTDLLPSGGALTDLPVNVTQINSLSAAAVRLALSCSVIIPGTVEDSAFSPTVTAFEAANITEATADHYNGRIIIFTSGALIGQATSISDYLLSGSNGKFTVVAMTEAPADGDTFIII